MKNFFPYLFSALTSILFCNCIYASYLPTRASLWAFGGRDLVVRGDIMTAILGNEDHILWTDLQGKYGEEATWMGSVGAGFRQVYQHERILGAYVFMDHNQSQRGNSFLVLSPGVESMSNTWDFRLNGYFPISSRTKSLGTVWGDEIGVDKFIVVTGHQQFNHFFDMTEEVGNGLDGEIGRTYSCINDARVYLGGYYFNVNGDHDFTLISSVRGISGRLEYPMRSHLSLQLIDTYDNLAHNTFLVGVKFSFGCYTSNKCRCAVNERILDPVSRNLGSQNLGTGIPIVEGRRDQGKSVLERDHIYFFDATNGSVFNPSLGRANGTAENPLIGTSFNQTTIDTINGFEPGANFYFTPGTYTFDPAPNGRMALNDGQSMWGRTQDYTLAAQGGKRALFLGGIDLFQGNNRLDSIRLLDNAVGPSEIIALEIENAQNVVLFNTVISAVTTVIDLTPTNNLASGIYGNNSQVIIKDSEINGTAIVNGINNGFNAAAGIGGNSDVGTANFVGNVYDIANSSINGNAIVNGTNNLVNLATGIGGNTLFGNTNFLNNTFIILNTTINGSATISGNNNLENFATGIGGNYANFLVIGNANFENNNFTIISSRINGTAFVGGDNAGSSVLLRAMPRDEVGFSFNYATGIGGNVRDFTSNIINLINSDITGQGIINGNNLLENYVTGLGGNFGNFTSNTINLTNTLVHGIATVEGSNDGVNFVTGMGGNAGLGDADFVDNIISISSSTISGAASVGANNISENFATGIGGNFADFIGNLINLTHTIVQATASISGINNDANFSTGIGGGNAVLGDAIFSDNIITISDLTLNVAATSGSNSALATNLATGVNMNNNGAASTGNTLNIDNSQLSILAQIFNLNSGSNTAIGLSAIGAGDVINISNSIVNVSAIVAPGSVGFNTALPQVTAGGGIINVFNTNFNIVVSPP